MTDREKFEAWATTERLHLAMEEGDYMSGVTRLAHRAWLASRQQMAEEAAAVCDGLRENSGELWMKVGAFNGGLRRAAQAILSLATPTEGKI